MQAMIETKSVAVALDSIVDVLDIVAAMTLKDETYDEVAAEEKVLGQIISRAQLILSFIDAREPEMRAVQ
jgi:hypothetical protein